MARPLDDVSRVLLAIPATTPEFGGNWSSAMRLAHCLRVEGMAAQVLRIGDDGLRSSEDGVMWHAFNATQSGLPLIQAGVPPARLVVTWTGTDVWQDIAGDPDAYQALAHVRAHTVLTEEARTIVRGLYPQTPTPVVHVPPGVDLRRFYPASPSPSPSFRLLLVGGGRSVKGTLEGIELVDALRTRTGRDVSLTVLGPVRDAGYWAEVQARRQTRPWLTTVDVVGFYDMPAWYQQVDAVVNTSFVEGLSNALLEAMASSRPVVARDIPGNRGVVRDGKTGYLFDTPEGFIEAFQRLWDDPDGAERLGRQGREEVASRFNAEREAQAMLALYRYAETDTPDPDEGGRS